jgi:hypothetical protein
MAKITATCKFHGQTLTDIPVINAGNWFGKTWLLSIGGGFVPLFLIVEADSVSDAIDELADSEEWGHEIVVAAADLGDYDPETAEYSGSGKIIDTDWLSIHGCEGCAVPFQCRYHGDGLPAEGVLPTEFCWDEIDADVED